MSACSAAYIRDCNHTAGQYTVQIVEAETQPMTANSEMALARFLMVTCAIT